MTKVSPETPQILVNDQELSVFELNRLTEPIRNHLEEVDEANISQSFCEYRTQKSNSTEKCHHVTCRIRREKRQKSNCISVFSVSNDTNESSEGNDSLLSEKHSQEVKAQRRLEFHTSILHNETIELSWYKCVSYTFGISLVGFLFTN